MGNSREQPGFDYGFFTPAGSASTPAAGGVPRQGGAPEQERAAGDPTQDLTYGGAPAAIVPL
ncbi:MAG: hypothetical protein M3Q27_12560, partial [Actinomycetota bacterium]|nr:hypothetical protein [Actinomycetota bacterium]